MQDRNLLHHCAFNSLILAHEFGCDEVSRFNIHHSDKHSEFCSLQVVKLV
jgi:hypothetical protein